MEDGHRITDEYLKKALASKHEVHPKDVTIKSFDVTGGSNKGDNFACEMKAVTVESNIRGKSQRDSFMAKCFPMNEARCKWLRQVSKWILRERRGYKMAFVFYINTFLVIGSHLPD